MAAPQTRGIRRGIDAVIDLESERVRTWADELRNGEITLYQWRENMQGLLKNMHIAAGIAAHGGRAGMTPADYGTIGRTLRAQYEYLRNFTSQIASGRQPMTTALEIRSMLYVQAARGTYEQLTRAFYQQHARQRTPGEPTMERRVLGIAEHCNGCLQEAAKDWQPIGTLKAIGETECLTNCHCTFQYRAHWSYEEPASQNGQGLSGTVSVL